MQYALSRSRHRYRRRPWTNNWSFYFPSEYTDRWRIDARPPTTGRTSLWLPPQTRSLATTHLRQGLASVGPGGIQTARCRIIWFYYSSYTVHPCGWLSSEHSHIWQSPAVARRQLRQPAVLSRKRSINLAPDRLDSVCPRLDSERGGGKSCGRTRKIVQAAFKQAGLGAATRGSSYISEHDPCPETGCSWQAPMKAARILHPEVAQS